MFIGLIRANYTKPLPMVGYRRCKQRSDFEGSASASYGYSAARKLLPNLFQLYKRLTS